MQKVAGETPNKAHQQTSVPLLRRPRAPKPVKVASTKSENTSPRNYYDLCDGETWDASELAYLELDEPDGRSNFVVHSLHPKGPEFFPPGKVLRCYDPVPVPLQPPLDDSFEDDCDIYDLRAWMPPKPVVRSSRSGAMLSRQNYKKLTSWFATHIPQQENLNTVQFNLEAGTPPTRKPIQQAIIGEAVHPVS